MTPHEPLATRFWRKVDCGPGCWVWKGAVSRSTPNYARGHMIVEGHTEWAHRISWRLANGEIPIGRLVLHKCDNPLCVNPDHLFLGTHADNTMDMIQKGRRGDTTRPGSANRFAKLTEADVIAMRAAVGVSEATLAARYGVASSTVHRIINRQKWRHI